MKKLASICLFFWLVGCATGKVTNIPFTPLLPKKGHGIIYIYRPSVAPNSLNLDIPIFTISGKKIGPLQMGSYYAEYAGAGEVKLSFTYNSLFNTRLFRINTELDKPLIVEASQNYYFRLDPAGIGGGGYKLRWIDEKTGLSEIQSMMLMSPEFHLKDI